MASINRKNWPLGWTPASNAVNGNPDGLLRMDNLQLNDEGVVSIVKGSQKLNTTAFSNYVANCFSKYINGVKYRYAHISSGSILRASGNFATTTTILSGAHANDSAFAATLGEVIVSSNKISKRDNGTNVYDLTVEKPPAAPVVTADSVPFKDVGAPTWNNWTSGGIGTTTNFATYVETDVDTTELQGVSEVSVAIDTKVTGSSIVSPDDGFQCSVRIGNTQFLKKFRIEFMLDSLAVPGTYYFKEWENGVNTPFNLGKSIWTVLEAKRSEFTRRGSNNGLNWSNVVGMRIIFVCENGVSNDNLFNNAWFIGGTSGPLNGLYEYMQVNVDNTGTYESVSEMSDIASGVFIYHGSGHVVPNNTATDPSINRAWIFRRSMPTSDDRLDPPALDRWYRVLELTDLNSPVTDSMSDEDALLLNITYNTNLTATTSIPHDILGIIADFNNRTLYMTYKDIYISAINNPGLIDSSLTITLSGDTTTRNLWIRKVSEGTIYIGTSEDMFVLSGSLVYLPDGTIDINVRSLGVNSAPIASEVDATESTLYYMAADGWRALSGTGTQLISVPLNQLFQGDYRHGLAAIQIYPMDAARYPVAIAKHRLWVSTPLLDGSRSTFVYDIKNQYWFRYDLAPQCMYTEEDGKLIAGFGGGSGNFLREIDYGNALDQITGQTIELRTPYMDNQAPNSRKISFVLRISADTGNQNITIAVAKDGLDSYTTVLTGAFNGKEEQLIDISSIVGDAFSYALKITGTGLFEFKLYHMEFIFDQQPEQATFVKIPDSNLGTVARKRFISYPFTINTLGNNVTFTPIIDGVAQASSTVTLNRKGTYIHYFNAEEIGTDIGGTLSGAKFELHNIDLNEAVSEKLPIPSKFVRIPNNNFGSPFMKRLRVIPMVIDTRGQNVTYTPSVDGVTKTATVFNTSRKETVMHYFDTDVFGIDYGGTLSGNSEFEFYGMLNPDLVEILPIGKKFDQIGPVRFDKIGKLIAIRIRVLAVGTSINLKIISDTEVTLPNAASTAGIYNLAFTTVANVDNVYEINMPVDIYGTIFRFELGPTTSLFYRYDMQIKVNVSGMPTSSQWMEIGKRS